MRKILAMLMVVAMLFAIAIPMSAEISPKPEPEVDAEVVPEGGGEVTEMNNGDGTITLTAKPSDGNVFVKWEFTGEFEWVKGDANSATITIRPITDVKAQAIVKGQATVKPTPKPDEDDKSPSTGVAPILMAVAAVASMAGAGYSFKKSGK